MFVRSVKRESEKEMQDSNDPGIVCEISTR